MSLEKRHFPLSLQMRTQPTDTLISALSREPSHPVPDFRPIGLRANKGGLFQAAVLGVICYTAREKPRQPAKVTPIGAWVRIKCNNRHKCALYSPNHQTKQSIQGQGRQQRLLHQFLIINLSGCGKNQTRKYRGTCFMI